MDNVNITLTREELSYIYSVLKDLESRKSDKINWSISHHVNNLPKYVNYIERKLCDILHALLD